jgi:hypothetical protein
MCAPLVCVCIYIMDVLKMLKSYPVVTDILQSDTLQQVVSLKYLYGSIKEIEINT